MKNAWKSRIFWENLKFIRFFQKMSNFSNIFWLFSRFFKFSKKLAIFSIFSDRRCWFSNKFFRYFQEIPFFKTFPIFPKTFHFYSKLSKLSLKFSNFTMNFPIFPIFSWDIILRQKEKSFFILKKINKSKKQFKVIKTHETSKFNAKQAPESNHRT